MFSLPLMSRSLRSVCITSRRLKYDKRDAELWKKKSTDLALDHFDDFYGSFYGKLWPSVRLSMLTTPKYCALVNYYGDYEATIQSLRDLGCVDIGETFESERHRISARKAKRARGSQSSVPAAEEVEDTPPIDNSADDRVIQPGTPSVGLYSFVPATKMKGMEDFVREEDQFQYLKQSPDFVVEVKPDEKLSIPPLLKAFVFARGDVTRFPNPKKTSLDTFNYYLMDAASILPVLALNLEPFDSVLDLCAAPGGKTLAIMQTVFPNNLVCNDVTPSRIARLKSVINQYLGNQKSWSDRLEILMSDAISWNEQQLDTFNKVLVDVPCTTDRHSVTEDDNNIFKPLRMRDRVKLPETQAALLVSGVRACKPGGTVVYSTCSLSPIQNDGVVYMALKQLKELYDIDTVVSDMGTTMQGFGFLSRFAPGHLMRYGQVALPSLPNNYGPMYISKIVRVR